MTQSAVLAQFRRVGPALLSAPVLVGALVAIAGAATANTWTVAQAATLLGWLTQVFTITVGVTAAVALTGDPLVELHESTPISFRAVQLLRAGIVAIVAVVGGLVMFVPLHLLGAWPRDTGWSSGLVPAGAALFIVAVALAAAAFSGTVSTVTISVVAGWIFLSLLWDPYILHLLVQRGIPLAAAAVMTWMAWRRLGNTEKNIAKVAVA
ncbi:hypothetical protein [Microbacterium saperdae]|uniref:Uncharacterized protein n=1 Tax=Microbacterium saperdae TaxID=69368 RepID=A0A543BN22_9MICO|nr:hypothetical protein [Microbacterium saperdae]TQL86224.1 hypothetical protein FB560_1874 [Microbacterium saperdae]GGM49655.1 hypothetical protein GCM10010489_21350 [Microbacterium saperdae]